MKSTILHKIVNFIYNNSIDEIETIYKGKVSDYMLSHLLDKKEEYKIYRDDNGFYRNLDDKNSEILFEFIEKNNIYIYL